MIAFLFRIALAIIVFSLVMSAARALGAWLRRHNARRTAGPAPRPERQARSRSAQGVGTPPEEIIDVPYRSVSGDDSADEP